ncbi:unnamed protein product [Ceratitis capitata]|uniref:(Mediterranean fruit fly) hypothetical protein n=1 Tax=Ceratitis capitata TaxID=7213 RepID=A0A811UGY5_CERCA|nr:unnamed protein product [Ceratitis capitata]
MPYTHTNVILAKSCTDYTYIGGVAGGMIWRCFSRMIKTTPPANATAGTVGRREEGSEQQMATITDHRSLISPAIRCARKRLCSIANATSQAGLRASCRIVGAVMESN